jgi:hypothetical protein
MPPVAASFQHREKGPGAHRRPWSLVGQQRKGGHKQLYDLLKNLEGKQKEQMKKKLWKRKERGRNKDE